MTTLDEHHVDLPGVDDDPDVARLVDELDTLGHGSPSPRGDMMIRHALAVHAQELAQQGARRPTQVRSAGQHRWTRRLRSRFGVALAASAAVLLSVGAYLHVQSPTPVSAQTVLHRAAAASPGPDMGTHAVYRVSSSDGSTGTADAWIGYDGTGAANELALTLTMSQGGQTGPQASAGLVATGSGLAQAYHPTDSRPQAAVPPTGPAQPGQVLTTPGTPPTALLNQTARTMKGIVVGTLLAQKLSNQPTAYTLRQETLNGHPVYALQPEGAGTATYYFNAQSYLLEGADWTQGSSSWQVRLTSSSTVPLSAVPAHTFGSGAAGVTTGSMRIKTGTAGGTGSSSGGPASSGGQVITGAGPGGVNIGFSRDGEGAHLTVDVAAGSTAPAVDLTPSLAAACDTTPQAFGSAMQTGRSILNTCRQTNPSISTDELVTALLAPVRSELDARARSGTISASQERSDLARIQTQLAHLVASGMGMRVSGPRG